nr:hypothetical protein [Pararhodobacter sp.]
MIFHPFATRLRGKLAKHARLDQTLKPVGKNRFGHAQFFLPIRKPMRSVKRRPHDQKRPAIADERKRANDRILGNQSLFGNFVHIQAPHPGA